MQLSQTNKVNFVLKITFFLYFSNVIIMQLSQINKVNIFEIFFLYS
jgi:hypothetical protein